MEILVMGSGTSHGVPMIGCDCAVCRSSNPKNKRNRVSVLVRAGGRSLMVDTGPEMRLQCIAYDVRQVDAVFITHTHADHIFGMDDLRRFNDIMDREIPVFGSADVLADIRRIFPYVFTVTQAGGGKPRLTLHETDGPLDLYGMRITPLVVQHGRLDINAYRFDTPTAALPAEASVEAASFGYVTDVSHISESVMTQLPAAAPDEAASFGYVTDVSHISESVMAQLQNLDLLMIDAVRIDPHPTHFGLYQALEVIRQLKPRRALLTHLSHHMDHDAVSALVPVNVELAYDGQRITL